MENLIISKKDDLTNIANAVREQTGETELLLLLLLDKVVLKPLN